MATFRRMRRPSEVDAARAVPEDGFGDVFLVVDGWATIHNDRSWWTGPECFVLVDDYDLVSSGPRQSGAPLMPYLTQARDAGLHLIVTRRAGGEGRAQFDPVLRRLRELDTPGLVMSGDREEGPLAGTVRPSLQPPLRGFLVTRREGPRLVQLAHHAHS
jgi:S-DNA-T family DNA segregation ATPase FtsK/SpoIIIE